MSIMRLSNKFKVNTINALCSDKQEILEFGGLNRKLYRLGESYNELTDQIWDQSDQRFVCKYAGRVGMWWSVTKSNTGLGSPIMSSPTKFELSPIRSLSANFAEFVQPHQSDARI